MTTGVTSGIKTVEDLFQDLVWNTLVTAALNALYVAIPGLSFLSPVINWFVKHFSEKLFEALRLTLDLKLIAFINAENRKDFDRAAVKLKILSNDYGIDSAEFKKYREDAKFALSKFVKLTGTQSQEMQPLTWSELKLWQKVFTVAVTVVTVAGFNALCFYHVNVISGAVAVAMDLFIVVLAVIALKKGRAE